MIEHSETQTVASQESITEECFNPDKYDTATVTVDDGTGKLVTSAKLEILMGVDGTWVPTHRATLSELAGAATSITLLSLPEQMQVRATNTTLTEQQMRIVVSRSK